LGKVRCETLKEIIQQKQLPHVDFLKIDTEGNDFAVLQGLGEYLRPSFTRTIYVEMTRHRENICALMASRGYAGFSTVPGRVESSCGCSGYRIKGAGFAFSGR